MGDKNPKQKLREGEKEGRKEEVSNSLLRPNNLQQLEGYRQIWGKKKGPKQRDNLLLRGRTMPEERRRKRETGTQDR